MTLPRRPRAVLAAAVVAAVAACGDPAGPAACGGLGTRSSPAGAAERWVLGQGARYPSDATLRARADELRRSQRARRAVAWEAVARTLAPVPLAQRTGVAQARVPRFRTWYDREDVRRMFQELYAALEPPARERRARFAESALDRVFGWNVEAVTTQDAWPRDRLEGWAAAIADAPSLAAVTGIQRIALSPDAARHLMASYPEVLRCLSDGAPPPVAEGSAHPMQRLAREPLVLDACGAYAAGPFFVARGARLRARLEGAGLDGAQLRVHEGVATHAAARCAVTGTDPCVVEGPGVFTVRVASGVRAVRGTLAVEHAAPSPDLAGCLAGTFPVSAATVALEWRRADLGQRFPVYDTSATALARRVAPGQEGTWGEGDGAAEPGEREAYTLRLPTGGVFRLAGMHLRTRELDHWLNITLWWSPTPDTDFGEDRPAAVRALGAPWSSYKMCVATDFDEQDPDPEGGFARAAPSLAAALRAVHEGRGGPSWCSNPYIDAGPGLVRSNCVGCHQHAMSGVRPGDVQTDPVRYPRNGRMQTRNNYPSDQFWGLDGGDNFASVFTETVAHWAAQR